MITRLDPAAFAHEYRRGNPAALRRANTAKAGRVAARTVGEAAAALELPGIPAAWVPVLRRRVGMPGASLAECAASLGMTKDVYAGALRRALAWAKRQPTS